VSQGQRAKSPRYSVFASEMMVIVEMINCLAML